MLSEKTVSEETLRLHRDTRLDIEVEEPPSLRVLSILCYNELAQAMGYPDTACYVVPGLRRWLAPFMNVRSEDIHLPVVQPVPTAKHPGKA